MENQKLQSNTQPNLPHKNWFLSHEFIYSVIGILSLVVVLGAVNWWRFEIRTAKELTIGLMPIHKQKADILANWKTYTNSQYGFSFKYPNDSRVEEEPYSQAPEKNFFINRLVGNGDHTDFFVTVESIGNQSFDSWFKQKVDPTGVLQKALANKNNGALNYLRLVSKTPLDYPDELGIPSQAYFYAPTIKSVIMFNYPFDDSQQASDKKLDQILSTFKFTDSEDISTWKTYTNSQYGFSFEYPAQWNFITDANESTDYKILGRVVNPDRAGKIDTDLPIEQFLIRSIKSSCEGTKVIMFGESVADKGWGIGFGNIEYRDLCTIRDNQTISISLSAFDQQSQAIMDQILSTFKFTK